MQKGIDVNKMNVPVLDREIRNDSNTKLFFFFHDFLYDEQSNILK